MHSCGAAFTVSEKSYYSCFLLLTQLDKKVITKIALGEEDGSASLIKHCCDKTKYYTNITEERVVNGTMMNVTEEVRTCKTYCKFISLYTDGL